MSRRTPIKDLKSEENVPSSPRRSTRIAAVVTRRVSESEERIIPSPARLTRSKRLSLSQESNLTDKESLSTTGSQIIERSTTGPARRTRSRGSLSSVGDDEPNNVASPIISRITTRRHSSGHSNSKSPTSEAKKDAEITSKPTPKRRGRKPSVTDGVVPLEAIVEVEKLAPLQAIEEGESKTNEVIVTSSQTSNEETICENETKSVLEVLNASHEKKVNDSGAKNKNLNLSDKENENTNLLNKSVSKQSEFNRDALTEVDDDNMKMSDDLNSSIATNKSSKFKNSDSEESLTLELSGAEEENVKSSSSMSSKTLNVSNSSDKENQQQTGLAKAPKERMGVEKLRKSTESNLESSKQKDLVNETSFYKDLDDYPPDTDSDDEVKRFTGPDNNKLNVYRTIGDKSVSSFDDNDWDNTSEPLSSQSSLPREAMSPIIRAVKKTIVNSPKAQSSTPSKPDVNSIDLNIEMTNDCSNKRNSFSSKNLSKSSVSVEDNDEEISSGSKSNSVIETTILNNSSNKERRSSSTSLSKNSFSIQDNKEACNVRKSSSLTSENTSLNSSRRKRSLSKNRSGNNISLRDPDEDSKVMESNSSTMETTTLDDNSAKRKRSTSKNLSRNSFSIQDDEEVCEANKSNSLLAENTTLNSSQRKRLSLQDGDKDSEVNQSRSSTTETAMLNDSSTKRKRSTSNNTSRNSFSIQDSSEKDSEVNTSKSSLKTSPNKKRYSTEKNSSPSQTEEMNKSMTNSDLNNQTDVSESDSSSPEFIDDQAMEVENEDTPSEDSNYIPEKGESIGSLDSDIESDDSYERDSFIVDSNEEIIELLSGDEYDLGQKKQKRKTKLKGSRIVTLQDSDNEEKQVVNQNGVKEKCDNDSDLENMSTQPYCGLSSPSITSVRESLSEVDKIEIRDEDSSEVVVNKQDNLDSLEVLKNSSEQFHKSPIALIDKSSTPNKQSESATNTPNNSFLKDDSVQTDHCRQSSITIQENINLQDLAQGNISERISKVVDVFCANVTQDGEDPTGNISLNISLEFRESSTVEKLVDQNSSVGRLNTGIESKRKRLSDQFRTTKTHLDDEIPVLSINKRSLTVQESVNKNASVERLSTDMESKGKRLSNQLLAKETHLDDEIPVLSKKKESFDVQESVNKNVSVGRLSTGMESKGKRQSNQLLAKETHLDDEIPVLSKKKESFDVQESVNKNVSVGRLSTGMESKGKRQSTQLLAKETHIDDEIPVLSKKKESFDVQESVNKNVSVGRLSTGMESKGKTQSNQLLAKETHLDDEIPVLSKKKESFDVQESVSKNVSDGRLSTDNHHKKKRRSMQLNEITSQFEDEALVLCETSEKLNSSGKIVDTAKLENKLLLNDEIVKVGKSGKKRKCPSNEKSKFENKLETSHNETDEVCAQLSKAKKKDRNIEPCTEEKVSGKGVFSATENQKQLFTIETSKPKKKNKVKSGKVVIPRCVPTKKSTEGDELEVNRFPSSILNTLGSSESLKRQLPHKSSDTKKWRKKPKVIPSASTEQKKWKCDTIEMSLQPSSSIFTPEKPKMIINKKDFKNKMLFHESKRMTADMLIRQKKKSDQN